MVGEETSTMKNRKIVVIGGGRGIGLWFANFFSSTSETKFDLVLCDIDFLNEDNYPRDSKKFKLTYDVENLEQLKFESADRPIYIISVPVNTVPIVVEKLADILKTASIIFNFSSVQNHTNETIEKVVGRSVDVVGIHLMFGPKVATVSGKNIVFTDSDHIKNRDLKLFQKFFKTEGAFLEYSSSYEHDKIMNVMQTLIHFNFFSFAYFLSIYKVMPSDLLKFQTLPGVYFFSLMARALIQNKLTYSNIQFQEGAEEIRNDFVQAITQFNDSLTECKSPNDINSFLDDLSDTFQNEKLINLVESTHISMNALEISIGNLVDFMKTQEFIIVKAEVEKGKFEYFGGSIAEVGKSHFTLRIMLFQIENANKKDHAYFLTSEDDVDYITRDEKYKIYFESISTSDNFSKIYINDAIILDRSVVKAWISKNVTMRKFNRKFSMKDFSLDKIELFCKKIEEEDPYIKNIRIDLSRIIDKSTIEVDISCDYVPIRKIDEIIEAFISPTIKNILMVNPIAD